MADGDFEAREAYLKRLGDDMIIDVECPRCNGMGEVLGSTPNVRARYVRHDDMDPGDFGEPCPKCLGTGTVEYDPNEDAP